MPSNRIKKRIGKLIEIHHSLWSLVETVLATRTHTTTKNDHSKYSNYSSACKMRSITSNLNGIDFKQHLATESKKKYIGFKRIETN